MLNSFKKNSLATMKLSYLLMIIGLFLWNWGTILFLSIFTFGLPFLILAIPLFGFTMFQAKSNISLFIRLFCSLVSLIPLIITLTALPLRTMTSENGDYIATLHGTAIAVLIIVSGIIFLLSAIYIFLKQYQLLQENDASF